MTKLVVCLLFFGLFAIQTVGHMNSDPAPGRSPGPPAIQAQLEGGAVISDDDDDTIAIAAERSSSTASSSSKSPAQIKEDYLQPKPSHNHSNHYEATEEDYISAAVAEEINFELSKSQEIATNGHLSGGGHASSAFIEEAKEALVHQLQRSHVGATTTSTSAAAAAVTSTSFASAYNTPALYAPPPITTNDRLRSATAATATVAAATSTLTPTTGTTTTGGSGSSTSFSATTATGNLKSCHEGFSDFLNDVDVIEELDTTDDGDDDADADVATNDTRQEHGLRIQLQLEHDIFDATTSTMGINCGLMYRVRLTTHRPASSSSSSSSSPSPSPSSLNAHYSGDFFVETLSTQNDGERGSFVGHSLSNKLPISWFSTQQRNGKDAPPQPPPPLNWMTSASSSSSNGATANGHSDAENSASSSDEENLAAMHNDYDVAAVAAASANDRLEPNAFGNKWPHLNTSRRHRETTRTTSTSTRNARGTSGANGNAKVCPDNKWRGSITSRGNAASGTSTESLSLWMVDELCEQDDTIEFRIFFRATLHSGAGVGGSSRSNNMEDANGGNNNANVDAQQHVAVYKKSFKFKLRKDCQLQLRETATSGTLDYTALPLYSTDCTVHFPSFQHLGTNVSNTQTANADADADAAAKAETPPTTATAEMPPPGILVELQRLNVPCSSGGYVRFNERTALCGKLEELPANDRSYHFDVRLHTSIRFVRNPMFSLNFKLVDYCYNVTTSNQTGEFYVRPSMRDSLECYFRVHLPHGNRIVLRLVTNNDSDILTTSTSQSAASGSNSGVSSFSPSGGYDEEDAALAIFTTLGLSVDTQIINLTLSGSGYMLPTQSRLHSTETGNKRVDSLRSGGGGGGGGGNRLSQKLTPANNSSDSAFAAGGTNSFAFLTANNNAYVPHVGATANCEGVVIKVFENDFAKWSHCVNSTRRMHGFILESSANTLSIHLFRVSSSRSRGMHYAAGVAGSGAGGVDLTPLPAIYLSYHARPVPEVVSNCAFGWVAMQQFCVSAIELALSWHDAEAHCVSMGGHLASIRNDRHQQVINELLLHSPGYKDQNAYWVGASDKSYEGDFRWSDGLLFQYTNWFPGWTQHGHYNKQPNDDGLSSQDCIELRRYFRTPPGIQTNRNPLTNNYMWNDRDCSAKNFLICERAMSDESFRRSWINDCNKTVSLTKEHPRASIWSPSFPRQYPDNANCFTTITAPMGYRVVIEFEELVIESEPGCTYDYLEITEPSHFDAATKQFSKSSKHRNSNSNNSNSNSDNNNNSNSNNSDNSNTSNNNKTFRKRSSYENPSLSSYASMSTFMSSPSSSSNTNTNTNSNNNINANSNDNDSYLYSNSYNNYNIAQSNYQQLLHVFSSLYKPHTNFLIQTPDYPKGNPYYQHQQQQHHHASTSFSSSSSSSANVNSNADRLRGGDEVLPKRLCGDWSSKLKLLRHVSSGSYLGLHFVSDYSHHYGGYKAKTYMENTASECANERLKPYNGSCYLFVSYPEVDWWTAQQVCRGIGAKLSSVSSADEHRFITSNIRNQIDYSPQTIYWLGAELEKSGQFEWTDDTKMSFQGWLPGQGQFDVMPADATCLGLQWKMSPTPMLPSGLYWQSQKCSKVGGYVCKKPKESFGNFAFKNFTESGTEGRLLSPAYPNTYPLNIDYWIHIMSPERTRIVVQFQKIDLEPQDECLYDFVSIQNYELISKITLEPGTNPQPMAMLTSDELMTPEDIDSERHEFSSGSSGNNNRLHRRIGRSIANKKYTSAASTTARKPKRNTENEFNLMTQSKIQMTHSEAHENPKAAAARNHARNPSWQSKRSRRRNTQTTQNSNGSDASETNENPKRRRRKNPSTEIENKLPIFSSPKNKNEIKHNLLPEMRDDQHLQRRQRQRQHQRRERRRRRSTIVGDFGQSTLSADNAQSFLPYVRWCGSHDSNMSKFDFVSSANHLVLNFHSDYSITGLGFAAIWKAIDISGCPLQTLTSREGTVFSPNYPHFLLNNLNCAYVIQAPMGRRVWLEFTEYDLLSDAMLEVDLGDGLFRPFRLREHLNEGIFVSLREQLRVQFRTGQHPRGKGFQAIYRTVGQMERRERVINLTNNATGYLFQLNYPHDMPENVDFTQHLVASFGDNILLELHGVEFAESGCPDSNILEIYDNYADNNGTKWQLCKFENTDLYTGSPVAGNNFVGGTEREPYGYDDGNDDDGGGHYHRQHQQQQQQPSSLSLYNRLDASAMANRHQQRQQFGAPPVYITSYLNTLYIRQRTTAKSDANLNATVRIQWDNNYKMKLASGDKMVESCQPNPCQFNGKCIVNNGTSYCQCQGHYTGRFCGLTVCDMEPCIFGKCELTATNFKCQCQPGYMGTTCEQKQRPCADNPCEGRGICFEKNGGFFCRCHAWWEGHRCERRMLHIPYKPLSERMLQEPFWLGLITVFVVLAVIGLVWCAKRHFPEKIEKLLAEEADRNRPPGTTIHGHHHHTSLREQLQFTTSIPQSTAANAPGAPRSIFNRLGIRKPSLLSLSSPNPTPGGGGAAARTFSLDDLLRPPPRRSPSPRKKRNNSTPVKKNAAEKKQILQQLVSPAAAQANPKVSLGELISMSENRLRVSNIGDSESDLKETTFSENTSGSLASTSVARGLPLPLTIINDPKLEKKVTFARLLNKVSAEMSSGSEIDIGQMAGKRNSSALSLPTDIQFRASSMPPSPCTNDLLRSPHSTSSNQGSDSLSSSDLALTEFGLRSLPTTANEIGGGGSNMSGSMTNNPRCRLGSAVRPKVSSADSILAMFRNFASTATTSSNTTNTATIHSNASIFVSPSTTPTASSPQDDAPGDDDSSTSSMHTPVSFSSGPPDSPVFYRQTTIEVPVLDVLNAHKNSSPTSSTSSSSVNMLHPPTILLEIPSNGINNKCLSPIREMPTPMPSPALTPIMPRPQRSNSPIFQEYPLSGGDFSDDEEKSDRSDRSDAQLSEQIILGLRRDKSRKIADADLDAMQTDIKAGTSMADSNRKRAFSNKVPLLRLSPAPATITTNLLTPPMITIELEPPTPEDKVPRPRDLIIPTLTVEQPSPTKNRHPMIIFPGSPPPQRASIGETSFMFPNKQQQKRLLKQFEKPTSLDFPFVPPMITITSNMSELESDTESLSPATKTGGVNVGLMPPNPVGMCYLSPFTMCSRADRTISESNLSSSGYSSMASPGPSRCGSSNPLCPNEMDEPGSGHSGPGFSLHVNLLNRRKSSALASCKENITNGKGTSAGNSASASNTEQLHRHGHRQRSDSETFSDDILLESNDEGIGTDHVDEKLDDHRLSQRRLKELDTFLEEQVLIEVDEPPSAPFSVGGISQQMAQLQLPSIVIQIDGTEKGLSPVSSRSESPLSERAGIGRFSPHFYGRKDQLPFTDSDGLYDFPSSDGKGTSAQSYTHQRRSSSKKRERKSSKCSASTQSPTKQQLQLDVPSKESLSTTATHSSSSTHVCNKHCHSHHHPCPASTVTTRKSPKRRLVNRLPIASSSSSSESLASAKELTVRPLPRRLNSPNREKRPRKQESLSEDEVADALLRRISPSIVKDKKDKEDETPKPKCKINRLRAIGNQIRFLRRLEKSIKTRERLASPSDSCPEENTDDMDSPQATSPLLQPTSPSKTRIALCRQKRLPGGTYGITAAALNTSNWKGMDRSLIGDDLNSD